MQVRSGSISLLVRLEPAYLLNEDVQKIRGVGRSFCFMTVRSTSSFHPG